MLGIAGNRPRTPMQSAPAERPWGVHRVLVADREWPYGLVVGLFHRQDRRAGTPGNAEVTRTQGSRAESGPSFRLVRRRRPS